MRSTAVCIATTFGQPNVIFHDKHSCLRLTEVVGTNAVVFRGMYVIEAKRGETANRNLRGNHNRQVDGRSCGWKLQLRLADKRCWTNLGL